MHVHTGIRVRAQRGGERIHSHSHNTCIQSHIHIQYLFASCRVFRSAVSPYVAIGSTPYCIVAVSCEVFHIYVRIYRYSMEGPTGRLPGLKPRGIDLRYRRLCTVRNRPWIRKYRTKSEEPLVQ